MATATVSGTASSYFYDAFGQRLKLKTPGTKYVVNIFNLDGSMQSETNSGTETDYAYLDGIPLSVIQPGAATISALHTDNIATVQRATDSTKTINWTGNYEPFGAVTPTTTITQNQRFLNNYADNTGYYHNGARDRNPSSTIGGGKFLQVDPIGIRVGPTSLNPYVYLDNNPYRWVDRFGHQEVPPPEPSSPANDNYPPESNAPEQENPSGPSSERPSPPVDPSNTANDNHPRETNDNTDQRPADEINEFVIHSHELIEACQKQDEYPSGATDDPTRRKFQPTGTIRPIPEPMDILNMPENYRPHFPPLNSGGK
jgi:RHS repeat-associated protein